MKQPLTNSELAVFSEQLALILHSGISVIEGISIMRDDTPDGEGKQILSALYDSLDMTGDITESLKSSEVFPEYFIKMTEIGERSGTLEEVMASLADYYERQDTLMRSIRDALTYPLILLGMLTAVLVVLMTQVMPVFAQVFEQLGIEITGLSGTIFKVSSVLQRISAVLLVLVIVVAAAALISIRFNKGKDLFLKTILLLPVGKKTTELLSRARFCDAFQLSLHSGLDIEESFELAAGFADQDAFREKLEKAHALIADGKELSDALKESAIITGLNARMMTIGFHTGSFETVLKQIAQNSQEEADQVVQAAVNALEPTLTAILSILTGLILVSIMLPLLGVMTNIG